MGQEVYQHTFPNGLTLLAERMEHLRSVAFNFLIPAGSIYDPREKIGTASFLSEWIVRGAGQRDSRSLSLALDNLGVDRNESVGAYSMRFWGATLSSNLMPALEIYSDIILRPHLSDEEQEAVQSLAIQEIESIEDDPRQKVFIELKKRHYPAPLGVDRRGTLESVQTIGTEDVKAFHRRHFHPASSILSVAGNFDWHELRDHVEKLFGSWSGDVPPPYAETPPQRGSVHLEKETTQTQIAFAYPSVPFGHEDYYKANAAVQILSGGMSGRLFTEVREKRGLCYAVSASYQTFKTCAAILCYAGTTTERAQETLDVTIGELFRLADGLEEDEVDRLKAGLKSSLIMQEESTSARAGALASDWYYLGRVRSLQEIQYAVDILTTDSIVEHVRAHPPKSTTLVTLGAKPLVIPDAIVTTV